MLGIWIGGWGTNQILLSQNSRSWPTVTGRIHTATIEVGASRFGQTYWPDIVYEYQIDDHSYINSTIIFGQSGPATQTYAQSKIQEYAPGTSVTVHYDPEQPQHACLEPGYLIWQTYLGLGIGGLFFVFGLGGLMRFFKKSK